MLLIAGCAGITISKAPALGSKEQKAGDPWNLAMTRFTVTINRHIIECGREIKAKVEPIVSASTAQDVDQRYLLTSNGWFATSDIKSTLSPTGYNTALNAETADGTATVVGNVIGTAVKVALTFASAGGASPIKTPPAKMPDQICSKDLIAAVDALYGSSHPPLKKQVEDANAALAQKTAIAAVLIAQLAIAKDDQTLKARAIQALQDQETARVDLQKKQTDFEIALKETTDIQTVTWPNRSTELRTNKPFLIDEKVRNKWLIPGIDGLQATKGLKVHLALYVKPDEGGWSKPSTTDIDLSLGLPVRLPRTAKLLMCVGEDECPETLNEGQILAANHTAADFVVLQAGPTYALPVSGGAFRSELAAVTLDANGIPVTLQTAERVAVATGLTTASKDVATQLATLPDSLRAAELSKTKAGTDQINADIALQAAKQSSGIQGQTSILAAQTALINAQINNSAAHQNASLQGIQQQTGNFTAQSSLLQAQAILATAQANAQTVDQFSTLAAQTTLINAQTQQINAAALLVKAQALTTH